MKYRKKPVIVDAEVYKRGLEDGFDAWCGWYEVAKGNLECEKCACFKHCNKDHLYNRPYINTLEGKMFISYSDYIITGVEGERYPCKPNIFHATYEEVNDEHS